MYTAKIIILLSAIFFLTPSISAQTTMTLHQAYLDKGTDYKPRTTHLNKDGSPKFINNLIFESSPYLLQHAHNPVNWHSWGDKALNKAKKENKLILLSIGYATCHWCHVMEEESFDTEIVANEINKNFIAIKVDREVRPDIDSVFMAAVQLINRQGGWPLNMFLTPDGEAFFGGTYFPQQNFLSVLAQVNNIWHKEPQTVIKQATEIKQILQQAQRQTKTKQKLEIQVSQQAITGILNSFDDLQGGFGQAPKFPHESMLLLLLQEQQRQPTKEVLNAIELSLQAMAQGGLYDVVAGGFARYSTDNAWLVPHFEKMLYNQAQLALIYAKAYQLTNKPLYKRIARQTLDYVVREMQAKAGGFYSATDADSEGEEGTFFIWDNKELQQILSADEFKVASEIFDFSNNTVFEDKHIIRYLSLDTNPELFSKADAITDKLYKVRQKRIPPLLDNKILLSWNAMMASTFIKAGVILNDDKYINTASKTLKFLQSFKQNGQLKRVLLGNQYNTDALLEDYGYLINLHLDLYDYSLDNNYLKQAKELMNTAITEFWDKEYYGFFDTKAKYLYVKLKNADDGAIPSANAVIFIALTRLLLRDNDNNYQEYADKLVTAFSQNIASNPQYYSIMIIGLNNLSQSELGIRQWLYKGKISAKLSKINNVYKLNINMADGYHINSNKPLQKDLIATSIENLDSKNWQITNISYPKAEYQKLAFSKDKLEVYTKDIALELNLVQKSKTYTKPKLKLTLQACNDTVCLAPVSTEL